MTIREIIQKLEAERDLLKKENKELNEKIEKLTKDLRTCQEKKIESVTVIKEVPVIKEISVAVEPAVEEVPEKPKRSRRKKTEETPIFVEPVEEPKNV